jgi:putative N-acetylmannosamine-6-phosphate epimerase
MVTKRFTKFKTLLLKIYSTTLFGYTLSNPKKNDLNLLKANLLKGILPKLT